VALEIVIRALQMKGEVIVPSFTFVATAHALQWQQITPVFCDIDAQTHTIDPARVEALITPRTSGILGVHTWGRACHIAALQKIAHERGLKLVFDAAHAFGCTHKGRMIGSFGDAEVFSFHATKFLNSFEGGAVATNNDELAQQVRLMRNFGFAGTDNVIYIGTNGKMTEVCAAMGLTSLEGMDEVIAVNRRNYDEYCRQLKDLPGISVIKYDPCQTSNCQYVVIEVDNDAAGLSQEQLLRLMHAENVLVRRYFYPGCHRMEPYRSLFPHAGLLLRRTEQLAARVLQLPTGTAIGLEQIARISSLLRGALEHAKQISSRLATP
jgi:dTDP-4-amino-4,6-dideoxygalactose transaminase